MKIPTGCEIIQMIDVMIFINFGPADDELIEWEAVT